MCVCVRVVKRSNFIQIHKIQNFLILVSIPGPSFDVVVDDDEMSFFSFSFLFFPIEIPWVQEPLVIFLSSFFFSYSFLRRKFPFVLLSVTHRQLLWQQKLTHFVSNHNFDRNKQIFYANTKTEGEIVKIIR